MNTRKLVTKREERSKTRNVELGEILPLRPPLGTWLEVQRARKRCM